MVIFIVYFDLLSAVFFLCRRSDSVFSRTFLISVSQLKGFSSR